MERFEQLLARVRSEERPLRVAVVGAGAAGVELACALQYRCGWCSLLGALRTHGLACVGPPYVH